MADAPPKRMYVFRRHFEASHRAPRAMLLIAPWINVLLLFILVLIQQSAAVLRPGVRLELPSAPFVDGIRPDALVLTIPQEGMFFFQDERLSFDGVALALERAVRANAGASVIIEADKRISYDTLVRIYSMARSAGVREIVLATRLERGP
ncbi:MAG: biopolymer transporter ExbD [Kiritimatiellae bacterium]|nr:biopolymer transporter ExbD [Kiritimatiellia bacterium]MCO5061593.1 biopolymer transporter ExbD [Kiritimatiellia bacterium]MCO6401114.1 biopolymer transporter ExbD [Verrucomicrobiota bacterium]